MIKIISQDLFRYKNYPSTNLIVDFSKIKSTPFNQLSTYFPWGDIPVPYSPGSMGMSLHSIWEGLKVFELCDVDTKFIKKNIRAIRSQNECGKLLGFRRGIDGHCIFEEIEARKRIYIKIYKWILENKAYKIILGLRQFSTNGNLFFIDRCTNCNLEDLSSPISTAFLVKSYIEGTDPYQEIITYNYVHHYYYIGRREICTTTTEKIFKEIPPKIENNSQLEIEFDY